MPAISACGCTKCNGVAKLFMLQVWADPLRKAEEEEKLEVDCKEEEAKKKEVWTKRMADWNSEILVTTSCVSVLQISCHASSCGSCFLLFIKF